MISDSKKMVIFCGIISILIASINYAVSSPALSTSHTYDYSNIVFPDSRDQPLFSSRFSETEDVVDTSKLEALATRLKPFHDRLTSQVFAETPEGNLIYSPISVSTVLTMVAYGAADNTLDEIRKQTGLPDGLLGQQGFQSLINTFNRVKGVDLSFANKVYASKEVVYTNDYYDVITSYFQSKPETLNFNDAQGAAKMINNWVKENTNGLIPQVVDEDDLEETLMMLLNAIYFKGKWAQKFNPQLTQEEPFHVSPTKTVNVPMMLLRSDLNVGRTDNAFYVELPYQSDESNPLSMYLFLPFDMDGLEKVEKKLGSMDFNKLKTEPAEIHFSMPKFQIKSKLNLKPVLEKMGIRKAFSWRANFSQMTTSVNLHISKFLQNAFIEVNEEGSTAAAVTTSELSDRFGPAEVSLNRPFLAAVVMKNQGIPLFYARIADPSAL